MSTNSAIKKIGRGYVPAVLIAEALQPAGKQPFQPCAFKRLELYTLLAGVVVNVAKHFCIDLPADARAKQRRCAAEQHPACCQIQFWQGITLPRRGAENRQQKRAQKQRQIQNQKLAQPVGAQQHRKSRYYH